jgi:enoyl-CoA hydratase/carnithine racemase
MREPSDVLRVDTTRGVAWVTIDHPPDQLVDAGFIGALAARLPALEADPGIRVAVFRSADPDFFLMHGDVRGILAMPPSDGAPVTAPNAAAALFQRIHTSSLVTIGMLDGIARGGGAEFLAALDLRYASTRAVLGQPEVPMGILPGAGGTTRLPRLLGRGRALEVILTGRDVDAAEALAIGWVDAVTAPEDLEATVAAVAERIAAAPPASIAAVKQVVDTSMAGLDAALLAESAAFTTLTDAGGHRVRMERFLAAGGQTRAAERGPIDPLLDAMRSDG